MNRRSRLVVLIVGLLSVSCGVAALGSAGSPDDDGPIEPMNAHAWLIRGMVGRQFTDGFEVLYLRGVKPATITSVRSVGGSNALEFLGAKLAGPTRKLGAWQLSTHWPPGRPAMGPLENAVGARILPVKQTRGGFGYELLVGYRVVDDSTLSVRRRIDVYYTVDGKKYVYRIHGTITFCPPTATDDTCLAAGQAEW